jgi:hypothetical protein
MLLRPQGLFGRLPRRGGVDAIGRASKAKKAASN